MAQWFFNVPGKCRKDYHKYYTLAWHLAKPGERVQWLRELAVLTEDLESGSKH